MYEADDDSQAYSFHSPSPLNWAVIRGSELDKLLNDQRRELDPTKRNKILRPAMKRVNEQAWNLGFVFQAEWVIQQPYVKNFRPQVNSREVSSEVWLEK